MYAYHFKQDVMNVDLCSTFNHPRTMDVWLQKLPSPKWGNWRCRFKVNTPLYWGMRFHIKYMEPYGNTI